MGIEYKRAFRLRDFIFRQTQVCGGDSPKKKVLDTGSVWLKFKILIKLLKIADEKLSKPKYVQQRIKKRARTEYVGKIESVSKKYIQIFRGGCYKNIKNMFGKYATSS